MINLYTALSSPTTLLVVEASVAKPQFIISTILYKTTQSMKLSGALTLLCWLPTLTFCNQKGYYKAAVAEYSPTGSVYNQAPSEVLGENLANYGKLIKDASSQAVDIIVFPEYGLTTLSLSSFSRSRARPFLQQLPSLNFSVPESFCTNFTSPVPDDQLAFSTLSCFARSNSIYVVANFGEIVYCVPGQNTTDGDVCPEDGACQYSTNAVFDREGRLIARYRKTHLFLEPLFQYPTVPDHSTFLTDFGVEFGLMICFDIMFYEPSVSLYYDKGIKHFAFPTAWVDELPFLTAAQIQEGWSRFFGINLLASGYHLPANGQLGSGVFGPNGPINYTFNPESGTVLVVGELQIDVADLSESTGRWVLPHGMLYENLTGYSNVELAIGNQSVTLCHTDLCCKTSYFSDCSNKPCDLYRLLSYSGYRTLGGGLYTIYIQLCGIVACTDETLESCAKPTVTKTAFFTDFELMGNFSSAKQVYPTAITKELQLLPVDSFQMNAENDNIRLNSSNIMVDVLAIGLYGRAYDKDNQSERNLI